MAGELDPRAAQAATLNYLVQLSGILVSRGVLTADDIKGIMRSIKQVNPDQGPVLDLMFPALKD